jgi:hypothetical protein
MKANEIFTTAEISDQVTFEDCMVKKVIPGKNLIGNNELDGFFRITNIHRDDLKELGFDVRKISDDQMSRLALKMSESYCRQLFWENLENLAKDMGIPRLMNVNHN